MTPPGGCRGAPHRDGGSFLAGRLEEEPEWKREVAVLIVALRDV